MSASSWGSRFVVTTFGESHGMGLGAVIDGCPAGVVFDHDLLTNNLARRRPGQSHEGVTLVTDRNEQDQPQVLSGVFEGKTLGTPIAVVVQNQDQRSGDYEKIKNSPRPGHADDVWKGKFHHSDHRGGGRSSGRETLARVIAGSIAEMLVKQLSPKTQVVAWTSQVGPVALTKEEIHSSLKTQKNPKNIDAFAARLPHLEKSIEVKELLLAAKKDGKSYGGIADIFVINPPPHLGQPVFHKLKSDLAGAYMSIGATHGVELGYGFSASDAEGSQFHDPKNDDTHRYGGIRGGISTGEPIHFRVAFKPTATVLHHAQSGRHDPCIIPRAIPVLEAMTYMVLADHILWARQDRV